MTWRFFGEFFLAWSLMVLFFLVVIVLFALTGDLLWRLRQRRRARARGGWIREWPL